MTIAKRSNTKYLLIAILVLFMLLLAACGGKDDSSSSSDANDSSTSSDEGNNEESNDEPEETYKFRMNIAFPAPVLDWDPKVAATEEFAQLVHEKTNGRVEIELFFNNQLVGQAESLDALAKGTIELQNTTPTAWADKIPESIFTVLPYWNKGPDHTMYMMRETEAGKLYEEALEEYGVKALFYWPTDATGFLSNKPIREPADLKGLTLNSGSSITLKYYQSMGAAIAEVPFVELYEGMLRGTLDAVQAPFSGLETYKFHEVVKYMTVPGTIDPMFGMIAITKSLWDELPEDIQNALLEAGKESEEKATENAKRLREYSVQFAEENGIEIVELTEEGHQEFIDKAHEMVWPAFEGISDRTKRIVEIIKEENEKWED